MIHNLYVEGKIVGQIRKFVAKDVQPVLVTGGAGFIGGHLVERLLRDGHRVTVLDNFSTGRMENLNQVKNNPRLSIYRVDISNYSEIKQFFEDVDWVFHLAALADVVSSIQHPLEYHRANVDGTITVLEAARSAAVKRFVYTASSSCYGIPDEFPTAETASVRPMYPYALTKYLGEPDCTLADIRKISHMLGWKPKVSFENGVQIMLQTIDYWRNAPVWTEKSIAEATRS